MKERNFEQYKRMLRLIAIAIIVSLQSAAFWWIWNRDYSNKIYLEPFFAKGNWYLLGMYILFSLLFLNIYGGLKLGYLKKSDVIYSQTLSVVCTNIIAYLQIVLLYRHVAPVIPIVELTILDFLCIFLCSNIFEYVYGRLFPPRKTLLIYEDTNTEILFRKVNTRKDKYVIFEKISVNQGIDKLKEEILKSEAVIISDVHSSMRNVLLKFCYSKSIRTYVTPKISDILIRSSEMLHLFDTPLLLSRNYGLTFEQKVFKRLLDIVISFILLVIFSPLMLITAIVIKSFDGGPILFKQKRLTINRREFYIFKFRSMIVDAEIDGVARLAKKNDTRITPIGNVIRKTRIDELPQLFNILYGNMSLVGPRPERPEIAEDYEIETPEFAYRLKVKAGLTGYAQVHGKYNTTSYDKLKLDLMYIENYSFLSDLKILTMTFKIMFLNDSTEGLEENEITASTKRNRR